MSVAVQTFERRDTIDAAAVAIMLGLTLAWGFNGVAAKLSYAGFSPMLVMFARSVLGGACVLAWCWWRGIRLFERDGTLPAGLLAGALFGIEFLLIFSALEITTVARSALMVNSMPFWVLIGAHFLLGERMSWLKVAGTALAFAGVALVYSDRLSLPDAQAIWGDVLSLLAGIAWAATTLVIKKSRLADTGPEKLLLYQLAVAAVMTLPLLATGGPAIREVTALPMAALLFQAVFVVAFTYILWFWMVRRYPAAGLSSFAFLTPAFGVLLGGLLLDEPLSLRIGLALALIAAGLIIVNRPPRKRASG